MNHALQIAKAIYYPLLITPPSPSHRDLLATADSIVGVPFGTHPEGSPLGAPNQSIVEEMLRLHELYPHLPLIAQWEMEDSPLLQVDGGLRLDLVIGERWHPHINTYEFFQELRAKRPDLKRPIIVAHQGHMRRCVWVAKRQVFEPRVPRLREMPFDPTSLHWQTHGPMEFFIWERPVVGWFALTGKI